MSATKLKKAPLKEVILELRWRCSITDGIHQDAGFDLAQGKFAEKLKADFPVYKKTIPDGTLLRIFGVPLHQYWKGEFKWPVVQHGEGLLAVNEVENGYEWVKFREIVNDVIDKLIKSYEHDLTFESVKLQYIDALDMDNERAIDFMKKNLQTQIITEYDHPGDLNGFNIQQRFNLKDGSEIELAIYNGKNSSNNKDSIIWTTTVFKNTPIVFPELEKWIENAHLECAGIFKKMIKKEFYESLD